jgi:hypothetical protein
MDFTDLLLREHPIIRHLAVLRRGPRCFEPTCQDIYLVRRLYLEIICANFKDNSKKGKVVKMSVTRRLQYLFVGGFLAQRVAYVAKIEKHGCLAYRE